MHHHWMVELVLINEQTAMTGQKVKKLEGKKKKRKR